MLEFLICLIATIITVAFMAFIFGCILAYVDGVSFKVPPLSIEVMSKEELEDFLMRPHERCTVISISDWDEKNCGICKPVLRSLAFGGDKINEIWSLSFDDVPSNCETAMTKEDAENIVDIIRTMPPTNRLIVQCEAGKCRSAGIAAAIGKAVNGDDSFVFENSKYVPNMHCYYLMLKAFEYEEPAEDATRNFKACVNWSKYNNFIR
jgi:hypothetical protein